MTPTPPFRASGGKTAPANETVFSLQVLRGLAASAVVLHHVLRALSVVSSQRGDGPIMAADAIEWLAGGVDVFFVISGFIMVFISAPYVSGAKPTYDFMIKRILRIYPIYIIATLILIFAQIASYHYAGGTGQNLNAYRIITSLSLFPSFNEHGEIQPILGVGWTLSYEVYFYIVFTVAILLSRHIPLLLGVILIILTVNIGAYFFHDSRNSLSAFLANPICIEFLYGCLLAAAFRAGLIARMPLYALLPAAALTVGISYFCGHDPNLRFLSWGAPAALALLAFLKFENSASITWPKLLLLVGDASYSIYIFHIIILYYIFTPIARRTLALPLSGEFCFAIGLPLLLFLISITTAIYKYVEAPMHAKLSEIYSSWTRAGATSIVTKSV